MEKVLDIIAYCIPALVVLACVYVVMMKFYQNENEKRLWELRKASQKEITPTRLRAYERLSLLLERTQPEHMLVDMPITELSVQELQRLLIKTVRVEFDHNLSQQIYVSDELWEHITEAKEQVVAFINAMATQLPAGHTTLDYAKILVTAYNQNGVTPHEIAIEALKNEVKTLL